VVPKVVPLLESAATFPHLRLSQLMLPSNPKLRALALSLGLLAAAFGAVAVSGWGQAGNALVRAELRAIAEKQAGAEQAKEPIQHERPPHPRHLDVAPPAQEAQAERAAEASLAATEQPAPSEPQPAPEAVAKAPDPSSMPPASAGTNGSYTPPPPSQRKEMTPHLMSNLEDQQAEGRAILIDGIALAPPNAPEAIKAAISAANEIVNRPYVWGGGHASWYSTGYDCSGAVSYALGGAGLLTAPLASTALESWGEPGPGRWLTVYASGDHAYAEIAGLRWDTVGDARGTGPRWHLTPAYPEGFVERHPPGY
jgi:cell wall-associated NlpC family hydrolase